MVFIAVTNHTKGTFSPGRKSSLNLIFSHKAMSKSLPFARERASNKISSSPPVDDSGRQKADLNVAHGKTVATPVVLNNGLISCNKCYYNYKRRGKPFLQLNLYLSHLPNTLKRFFLIITSRAQSFY